MLYNNHFSLTLFFLFVLTIGIHDCIAQTTYTSTDVPIAISTSDPSTISSTLNITDIGNIGDINVLLDIEHTYINDLIISLQAPNGTVAIIVNKPCGGDDNIVMIVDDEGASSLPCPPVDGGAYQASNSLSGFDGLGLSGTWTLTVEDTASGDGGNLNAWALIVETACNAAAPVLAK